MTASLPVTDQDLIDNLKFQVQNAADIPVRRSGSSIVLSGSGGALNEILLSEDGKTITFGSYTLAGGPNLAGFTYGA